jgi:hypothetical protein
MSGTNQMAGLSRRGSFRLAGVAGAASAAGAAGAAALGWHAGGPALLRAARTVAHDPGAIFHFRAVAGMPARPMPAYATYVVTGQLDLAARSGSVTQTVYAGAPDAMSAITLPGLARTVRVTDVQEMDSVLHVAGVIDDRSQLQPGEGPNVQLRIDRSDGTVRASFYGSDTELRLAE